MHLYAVTTEGEVCVFPFILMKKTYTEGTKDGLTTGRLWCATTSNYDTKLSGDSAVQVTACVQLLSILRS